MKPSLRGSSSPPPRDPVTLLDADERTRTSTEYLHTDLNRMQRA
jgi:hypothetical protein